MRNVGALAQFDRQQYPPVKTPAVHQRERPLTLNPLLDPACELCLLPIESPGWYDYSHNGYYGTLQGAVWTANGRYGPAVFAAALGNCVNMGAIPALMFVAGDFTVEHWIYPLALANNPIVFQRVLWNADGYTTTILANGQARLHTFQALAEQTTLTGVGTVVINQWYHFVARRQGAAAQIFLNGVDATAVPAVHINPVGVPGRIGYVGDPGGAFFNGYTDLVRVYSRYLGDQEILDLYEQGRPGWL